MTTDKIKNYVANSTSGKRTWAKACNLLKAVHAFQAALPQKLIERRIALSELWIGLAAEQRGDVVDFGFACYDGTYDIDFAVHTLSLKDTAEHLSGAQDKIADYLVHMLESYEKSNRYKFVGAGLAQEVVELSTLLPARLWAELDVVPIIFKSKNGGNLGSQKDVGAVLGVDEFADSMARKCLMYFGPSRQPQVQVGFRDEVLVDLADRAPLTVLAQYKPTVSEQTWRTLSYYAGLLRERETKIAFFSATPQGGGVALMRHALVRLFRLLGVDCTWWVPKPKPEVFRITKTNHNILQGVADPEERLTKDRQAIINAWIQTNAERFWTRSGGPLAPPSQGGADVIIVDDPQMPLLVEISKRLAPDRPVIFRSHIQIRADLADTPGSPTSEVWGWMWSSIQHADVFVSHPVRDFVPKQVKKQRLAWMGATTDWLDGLNKELGRLDQEYYLHGFNTECNRQQMTKLAYPKRKYIIQVARFDPAKGIPHVLAGYAEFRRHSPFCKGKPVEETPQLVICGPYSVDDPDGTAVLGQTLELLDKEYVDLQDSVIVMRIGPVDQLLNALLSNAHIALQLSTREGFEVKVSEALHKGIPVIASKAGGIPLQVQHERSGFLVEPSDKAAVAKYLDLLFSNEKVYSTMSHFAASHVSDEVGTVGNAVCWAILANMLTAGPKDDLNGQWVWDLARERAGEPILETEVRLPRDWTT